MSETELDTSVVNRAKGCMLGAAVGDAVGAFLEWKWAPVPESEIKEALALKGGGPHLLAPGQVTDDTEQALCLAAGLIEVKHSTKSIMMRNLPTIMKTTSFKSFSSL